MAEAQAIRLQGNDLFRAGKYVAAKAKYRDCLGQAPDEIPVLSNLSAVHLKLKEWQPALACANKVLASEPQHFKCLSRAGLANMHLERYHAAVACLQNAAAQEPKDHTAKAQLAEARERLQQSRGEYAFKRLYFRKEKADWRSFSSYTNVKLSIKQVPGKGRGVVLTGAVRKGDLLAVCRPLAVASKHPIELQENCCLGCLSRTTRERLHRQITGMAAKDPHVLKQLYALDDGTLESLEVLPPVTLFQGAKEKRIHTPDASTEVEEDKRAEVDKDRLARVVKLNTFETGGQDHSGVSNADPILLGGDRSPDHFAKATVSGLYPLLSMINHSCSPNCCHIFLNDVGFLRAAEDLKKGDEVTIGYNGILVETVEKRREELDNLGFTCMCERCCMEAKLPEFVSQDLQQVQHAMDKPGGLTETFHTAHDHEDKSALKTNAEQLRGLLKMFEGKLDRAELSAKHKLWMQFCLTSVYTQLGQCYDWLRDTERLFQTSQHVARMYEATMPGSESHIIEVIHAIRPFRLNCPGSQWHLKSYLVAQQAMYTRYGPSLDEKDNLVDSMMRIDDRMTTVLEWRSRSKRMSDTTAFFNARLPYEVAEYRSVVPH